MTVIPAAHLDEDKARLLTERIRSIAVVVKGQLETLQHLLNEARDGEAWRALGYASWTAYLSDVMGDRPLRLPRDERQQIVGYLAGEGMSSRAIAPIVGISYDTVQRDIRGDRNLSPEPHVNTVTGEVSPDYVTDQADLDAATELPDEGVGAPRDSGDAEPSGDEGLSLPSPSSRSVTGLDGKTYTRPEPQTPRRRPITDAFLDKRVELHKTVEALCRLTQDDRFPLNAEKVATANRSDLIRARDLLQQVIDSIPEI